MTASEGDFSVASAPAAPPPRYRYRLERDLETNFDDPHRRRVLFVMLNPSTADERTDDATIRRCRGFARAWGFHALRVVNLFAMRSTDPRGLLVVPYAVAVGPENDDEIRTQAFMADQVVLAWGAHHPLRHMLAQRAADVVAMLRRVHAAPLMVLGLAQNGQPLHPLRQRADLKPQAFAGGRP